MTTIDLKARRVAARLNKTLSELATTHVGELVVPAHVGMMLSTWEHWHGGDCPRGAAALWAGPPLQLNTGSLVGG